MAKRHCKNVSRNRDAARANDIFRPSQTSCTRGLYVRPSVSQSVYLPTYLPEITTVACNAGDDRNAHIILAYVMLILNIIIIYNVYATIRADFVMG